MRVIIAGGREYPQTEETLALIDRVVTLSGWEVTRVVSGCQRGIDVMGERWAYRHAIPIDPNPAHWDEYRPTNPKAKNPAGAIRNRAMAEKADALIAIPGEGPGTWNMVAAAKARQLPVFIYDAARGKGELWTPPPQQLPLT